MNQQENGTAIPRPPRPQRRRRRRVLPQEAPETQSMEIPGEPEDEDMELEQQSSHRRGVIHQPISSSSEEDEVQFAEEAHFAQVFEIIE